MAAKIKGENIMAEKKMKLLLTAEEMENELGRVAKEIIADGTRNVALIGIRSRGVPLAKMLASKIETLQKKPVEVGALDINLYRDDLSEVGDQPVVKNSQLPFSVEEKGIILVDDVLYTGRTIRAAMDALIDCGRPKFIKLAAMIDRGWREFPIQPDYVGKKVKTVMGENVKVMVREFDGENRVMIKGA